MILIGIIGRIGAGKSTVARLLAAHGARVIDADRIAHDVLLDADVQRALVARFGQEVIQGEPSPTAAGIDRKALARIVFGPTAVHRKALADLEAIVHPRVHERMETLLAGIAGEERRGGAEQVAVLDVPLLVRGGWLDRCDRIVVLECPDDVRRARIAARFSGPQIEAREASWNEQSPQALPAGKTATVDTSGDPAYTQSQIDRLWLELSRRSLS
jgi:dephospho-CoA kinase